MAVRGGKTGFRMSHLDSTTTILLTEVPICKGIVPLSPVQTAAPHGNFGMLSGELLEKLLVFPSNFLIHCASLNYQSHRNKRRKKEKTNNSYVRSGGDSSLLFMAGIARHGGCRACTNVN